MTTKKPRPDADRWPGGYVRTNKSGRTFIIERKVGGVHFHVSTRCKSLRAAMKQLERFEADPANYSPAGVAPEPERKPLVMTADLVLAYRDWMLSRERPASREWALNCANYLADWIDDLGGKDLREVTVVGDLEPALDRRKTSRRHRIEAIKAFYGWLRKKRGLIRHAEDPTPDIAVPQGSPEKHRRVKVVPRERVLAVLPHLPSAVRDVLILKLATSWHTSEVRRFAREGVMIPGTREGVLFVLQVRHKSGELTRTPLVHQEHVEAAQRILAKGKVPDRHQVADAMRAGCQAAGVTLFHLGQIRHSVLTWAVEQGASIEDVAEFAHHRSPLTTKKFYLDVAEPAPRIPVLRILDGGKKTETA